MFEAGLTSPDTLNEECKDLKATLMNMEGGSRKPGD